MESKELREVGTQLEQVADVLVGADVNESGVDAKDVAVASEQVSELIESTESLEKGKKKLKTKVRNRDILIVILLIIIILLLLTEYIFKSLNKEEFVPKFEDGAYIERVTEEIIPAPDVHLPMFNDFIINEEYPYHTVYNPEINEGNYHVSFSFVLDGENEPFYETDFLKAGDKVSINFLELLPAGEHKIDVYSVPVTVDTFDIRNSIADSCKITVVK